MKASLSKDGIMRRTFRLDVRLSLSDIEDIMQAIKCKDKGKKADDAIREFLVVALEAGIEDGLSDYYESKENDEL